MKYWQDLREAALTGAFNHMGAVYLTRFENEWPDRRGHTVLLPCAENGHAALEAEAFAQQVDEHYRQSPTFAQSATWPARRQRALAQDVAAVAHASHRWVNRTGTLREADGDFISSRSDYDLQLSRRQRELDIDVLAIKVHAPLSLEGRGFAAAARQQPDDAFLNSYQTIEAIAHESAHAISRHRNLPSSCYQSFAQIHTEEVRATLYGGFVAGQVFGPAMQWSLRSSCSNADDLAYHAPDIYRSAAHWMGQSMTRPPADQPAFSDLSLPQLFAMASYFAERQHQTPAQREAARLRLQQAADFVRQPRFHKSSPAARLQQAQQQGKATVYGPHQHSGPWLDRALVLATPLVRKHLTRSLTDNPLKVKPV